ncbi:MAG TPA: FG-GAP repeat protein, partial [Gammaproteobacteria bacterium]|nr:FG-GAP repeat protein [Gammaproteobacteria bacterium]
MSIHISIVRVLGLATLAIVGILPAFAAPAAAGIPTVAPGAPMPAGLRAALYRSLASDGVSARFIGGDGCATLGSSLRGCFDAEGAHFNDSRAAALTLRLLSWGRGATLRGIEKVQPVLHRNGASFEHGGIRAWWRVLPIGFEQGFTIAQRPAGSGELTLELAAGGNPRLHNGELQWGPLHYGQLAVTDARGHSVPAALSAQDGRIRISVHDGRAVYPLTVDPLLWQEQAVNASDGHALDQFGFAVAISGTTAIIGAPAATVQGRDFEGAAYVFTESGGVWSASQKLTPSDNLPRDSFGWSVALNGTTAVVGATGLLGSGASDIGDGAKQGAAYVFAESGGVWSETQRLTAHDGINYDEFGWSVAISGTNIFVGALNSGHSATATGAVYVFTLNDGVWARGPKLLPDDSVPSDGFGDSIAATADTLLVGSPLAEVNGQSKQGAVYVFAQSDGSWTQSQKFTADDGATDNFFGDAVAVSGSTALIGASYATVAGNNYQGAAYVFGEAGGIWTQQQKLVAADGAANDNFGTAVALAGSRALVAAPLAAVADNDRQGAAYVFEKSGGNWSQAQKFVASDGASAAYFGWSVALDQAPVALIGASYAAVGDHAGQGEAYFESGSGGCPQGYSEYDGSLPAGGRAGTPVYSAPEGIENAILTAPDDFSLYARFQNGQGRKLIHVSGHEVHRWGPAGQYEWLVQASP